MGSWQLCMLKSYGCSGEDDEKSDNKKKKEEGKRRRTLANTVEVNCVLNAFLRVFVSLKCSLKYVLLLVQFCS